MPQPTTKRKRGSSSSSPDDPSYQQDAGSSSSVDGGLGAKRSKQAKVEKTEKDVKKSSSQARAASRPFTREEDLKIIAYLKKQVDYTHLRKVVLEDKRSKTSVRARYLMLIKVWENALP